MLTIVHVIYSDLGFLNPIHPRPRGRGLLGLFDKLDKSRNKINHGTDQQMMISS